MTRRRPIRRSNPMGFLPLAPLVYFGVAAAATWFFYQDETQTAWQKSLPPPTQPPPPAAPQTPDQMTSWTPADLDAADRANYEAWQASRNAIPMNPEAAAILNKESWTYPALAVAGIALIALVLDK